MKKIISIFLITMLLLNFSVLAEENVRNEGVEPEDDSNVIVTDPIKEDSCPLVSPPSPLLKERCTNEGGKMEPKTNDQGCITSYSCNKDTTSGSVDLNRETIKERRKEALNERREAFQALREQKKEAFKDFKEEEIEKFAQLRQEQLSKIKELRKEEIEKFKELNKERLRKVLSLEETQLDKIANLANEDIEKLAKLDRARIKEFSNLNEEQLKEKLKEIKVKKVKLADLVEKRKLTEEKIKEAKDRLQNARQKFIEVNEKYKERKEKFNEIKDKLEEVCKEETEECAKLREEAQSLAAEFLTHSADKAINYLQQVKSDIESNENLEEDKVTEMIAELDTAIKSLEEQKAKIPEAKTKEELKAIAQEINNVWKNIRVRAGLHTARLIHAKVGTIIVRSEHLEQKLDKILSKAEEAGIELDVEDELAEFSEKIAEAREKHDEAQDIFNQAITEKSKDLVKEARDLEKEASNLLKEAHEILKEIVQEIRNKGMTIKTEEDEEVEVVEETEENEVEEEAEENEEEQETQEEVEESEEQESESQENTTETNQ